MPGATSLQLTGERTLPDVWHENYWFARHEAAYRHLAAAVVGARVLDAGCGEGYGAAILLEADAAEVVALDYDAQTVRHVSEAYERVHVVSGNLVALPLGCQTFDFVVSFQTIEHLWDQQGFVRECARVMRPGGLFVLSTPNRLTFSPGVGRGEKPLNPFHINEFDVRELVELVSTRLVVKGVHGLVHGPRLIEWEAIHGSIVQAQLGASPEAWSKSLTEFVSTLTYQDFDFTDDDLDSSLDLVVLARGHTSA